MGVLVGFESILRMIEYRYGLSALTRRDQHANNIALAFDWESPPNTEPGTLPTPTGVVDHGAPCGSPASPAPAAARGRSAAPRPKPHDMTSLRTSGYLERLGFHYRPATHESTWREPHKMRKAIEASR